MKNNRGFTMMELLIAMLILMIATTLIVQCTQIANHEFDESTMRSEAQILAADISTTIQDELVYASAVQSSDAHGIVYTSYRYGANCYFSVSSDRIYINTADGKKYPVSNGGFYTLGSMSGNDRVKADLTLSYSGGKVHVAVTIVDGEDAVLAKNTFQLRPLGGATPAVQQVEEIASGN